MENYEKYALNLSQSQELILEDMLSRFKKKSQDLREKLAEICPDLNLEKLSPKDRERWQSVADLITMAEIEKEKELERVYREFLLDHLQSLGNDEKKILEDAAARMKYLYFAKKTTKGEILTWISEFYSPLFSDPAAAETVLQELLESVVESGSEAVQLPQRRALPPIRSPYSMINGAKTIRKLFTDPPNGSGRGSDLPEEFGLRSEENAEKKWYGYVIGQGKAKQNPKKHLPEIKTYVALNYADLEIDHRLTAFDLAVYNAVINRYIQKTEDLIDQDLILTPQEIWRTMIGVTGDFDRYNPSPDQLKAVRLSMEKLRRTFIKINVSEEIKHKIIRLDGRSHRMKDGFMDDQMISASRIDFRTERGGQILTGYRIKEEPILYQYVRSKGKAETGQIISAPYDMLKLESRDGNNIEIGQFLLVRIMQMKSGHLKSRRIKFSDMYESGGITLPEQRISGGVQTASDAQQVRRMYQRDRERVVEILKGWIAAGHIRGYKFITNDPRDELIPDPQNPYRPIVEQDPKHPEKKKRGKNLTGVLILLGKSK